MRLFQALKTPRVQLLALSCLLLVSTQQANAQKYQQQTGKTITSSANFENPGDGGFQVMAGDGGEQVDRLALASGDAYLRPQQVELVREILARILLQQQQRPSYLLPDEAQSQQQRIEGMDQYLGYLGHHGQQSEQAANLPRNALSLALIKRANRQQQQQFGESILPFDENCQLCNYQTLVDEYKQLASRAAAANPSRENRAFKPKLMSTARGFGKRSVAGGSGNTGSGMQRGITYDNLAQPSIVDSAQ